MRRLFVFLLCLTALMLFRFDKSAVEQTKKGCNHALRMTSLRKRSFRYQAITTKLR
jgi:hypothetical protein